MECSALDFGVADNAEVQQQPPKLRAPAITGLLLLITRGALLWVVVPTAILCWILGWPYWRQRHATLGHVLGWADLNLVAVLERGPLRLLVINPRPWTPFSDLPHVTHRLRAIDPA